MNGGDEVVATAPPQPLEWKFSQVFGERTAGEEIQEGKLDIIFLERLKVSLSFGFSGSDLSSVCIVPFSAWLCNLDLLGDYCLILRDEYWDLGGGTGDKDYLLCFTVFLKN